VSKELLRKKCIKKFKNIGFGKKIKYNSLIIKTLEEIIQYKKPQTVLIYLPFAFEANLNKLINKYRKKIFFFVPFMQNISFKMVPYRLPIKKYKFNVKQSGNSHFRLLKIDLAVVPAIGIDKDFKRIGFGKGMYDRFFETLKYRPYTVFIQPLLCDSKEKLSFEHDISGDLLLTFGLLFDKKGWKNGYRTHRRRGGYCRSYLFCNKKNRSSKT
jgi:5-formyltetrahydrofolate cyclo-ligase